MQMAPLTMPEKAPDQEVGLIVRDGITAFPHFWQVPAATEKAAYEAALASRQDLDFEYFGFPWATIIDGLRGDAVSTWKILVALNRARKQKRTTRRRVTVAQHIHAIQFIDLFKACGITDIFWSHTTRKQTEIEGIRLHPFPLFPAQTPNKISTDNPSRPRKYLANFIGAFSPSIYLSDVRQHILNDAGRWPDVLIIKRDGWHFDRAVYEEQVKGVSASEQHKQAEQRRANEYLDAIRSSWFTLCPTGSGPSSIRIFEALALASIPVILTKDLRFPGDHRLLERATIIEEDSQDGYKAAIERIRRMNEPEKRSMLMFGAELYKTVNPISYSQLIINGMNMVQVVHHDR